MTEHPLAGFLSQLKCRQVLREGAGLSFLKCRLVALFLFVHELLVVVTDNCIKVVVPRLWT